MRTNPTPSEKEMWKILKENFNNFHFMRQKPLGEFIADFYCSKLSLIIEVDGNIHAENNNQDRDKDRDNYFLDKYNITSLRFSDYKVLNDKEYVVETIQSYIDIQIKSSSLALSFKKGEEALQLQYNYYDLLSPPLFLKEGECFKYG